MMMKGEAESSGRNSSSSDGYPCDVNVSLLSQTDPSSLVSTTISNLAGTVGSDIASWLTNDPLYQFPLVPLLYTKSVPLSLSSIQVSPC